MKNRIRNHAQRGLFFRDGVWWCDVRVNGKRHREKAGATEKEARAYRDDLKAWGRACKRGEQRAKPAGMPVLFETFADDYLKLCSKRKRSGSRDERCMAIFKQFFKGRHLQDIGSREVAEYRVFRNKVKASTRNREVATLKTALRTAVKWGLLARDPLPPEDLKEEVIKFVPRPLSYDEAARLIEAAKPAWVRDAIICFIYTGLRRKELFCLRREDVDFAEGTLTVRGENSKSGRARTIPPKPLVLATLRAQPGKVYFFESPAGKPRTDILKPLKAALETAGLPLSIRTHDLRHTYGSLSIQEGTDPRTLSELMGHSSPMITLEVYCTSNITAKRQAADRLRDVTKNGRELHGDPVSVPATASPSVN